MSDFLTISKAHLLAALVAVHNEVDRADLKARSIYERAELSVEKAWATLEARASASPVSFWQKFKNLF